MGLIADVTVCTATIPPRAHLLKRAFESVENQTLKVKQHLIECDDNREGQTVILDRLINTARTKYVAIFK